MKILIVAGLLVTSLISLIAAPDAQTDPDVNHIWQFFVESPVAGKRLNLGAYLWIPPDTPKIRAVMVGLQNALAINVLQSAPVRAVCRKQGIAQILLTPWAKDISDVMLKDLNYDVTDPARTAVYDHYLKALADVSGHPELVQAPIVPLAHSAYCDFPFDAAMRRPAQCLAAIPIKAGLPDLYRFYAAGGKSKTPAPQLCLRNVPILFVESGSQETVPWRAYPHGIGSAGLRFYRRDHDDNPGTSYQPQDELFGVCWDMMSGHFDMLPRDYQFVADWLEAVATARLPDQVGGPLKNLHLADGWLMPADVPASGDLPADFPKPAPYLEFKGHRNQAYWYPNRDLAGREFDLANSEPRKKIELFTFLGPDGKPISLAMGLMAAMPDPLPLLHGDGLFMLTTHHFLHPPAISTVSEREHKQHPEIPLTYTNVLFPGQTNLPVSALPLAFDPDGAAVKLERTETFPDSRGVTETRFTLRLGRNRMAPDDGFVMMFLRAYDQGNPDFAAAGRTCQIAWWPSGAVKNAASQTVDFPAIPDTPMTAKSIELHAKSSAGLPVDYFVLQGPGIIQDGAFVPDEIPAGATKPMAVTIGAYQVGRFEQTGGVKPAATVYRTFQLTPPFPKSNSATNQQPP